MIKQMIAATCPDIDLSGDYPEIMPRVTTEQLGQLLDVGERGEDAEIWSWMAVQFLLRYGQQDVVAESIDRLVAAVKASGGAARVLRKAPHLTAAHRDTLVAAVTKSGDAAWVLEEAPNLSDENRDTLVPLVADSDHAAWVLRNAPNLSEENRKHLETMVKQ